MSVSEWEQTKSAHHERRMAIMNGVHDIVIYNWRTNEMTKKEERFEQIYSQGKINVTEIRVDKETGVSYMFLTTHLLRSV